MKEPIRLSQTVKKGGCAAKVAAIELRKILSDVRFPSAPPELLIDGRDFDDAAVYQINESTAIVQTIDFFTPIIDSPYDFGRVAAANAISDIYAMGGRPVSALAVLAFPLAELDNEVIATVMQGACDVLAESGAALAGGHSIDDDTLKFGLAVTGTVHPQKMWANRGARAGDKLILTKGLGTGTITAAIKQDQLRSEDAQPAIESMARLNNAVDWLEPAGVSEFIHAATDITGFGFSGHSMQMAKASAVAFRISMDRLPRLPHAESCLERGFLTKAHRTNREYSSGSVRGHDLKPTEELLLHDPQTSGGLLLSIAADASEKILGVLRERFPLSNIVGEVVDGSSGSVDVYATLP